MHKVFFNCEIFGFKFGGQKKEKEIQKIAEMYEFLLSGHTHSM